MRGWEWILQSSCVTYTCTLTSAHIVPKVQRARVRVGPTTSVGETEAEATTETRYQLISITRFGDEFGEIVQISYL
jgi:hypothetical protein